jgi:sec-independent protein translocase protein TatA
MPNVGVWEILILLLVLLLIFGPKRLPSMGRNLGRGMREFKESVTDQTRELKEAVGDTPGEFKQALNPLATVEPKPEEVVGEAAPPPPPAPAAEAPTAVAVPPVPDTAIDALPPAAPVEEPEPVEAPATGEGEPVSR